MGDKGDRPLKALAKGLFLLLLGSMPQILY
jgi:hypothetical protein